MAYQFLVWLVNYLYVLVSIIAFTAPFWWLYIRHERAYRSAHQTFTQFNLHLEHFFESRYANWLVFTWALAEAVTWFVIPEFLLLLIIFMRLKRTRELLIYDVAGTIAGAIIAYCIGLSPAAIAQLPYIQPNMIVQVQLWYQHWGLFGLFFQPFSGVPYKVFAHLAPAAHFWLPAFIAMSILVRLSRYYIIFAMLRSLVPSLHRHVFRRYIRLALVTIGIFSVLLLRVYESYGPAYHFMR